MCTTVNIFIRKEIYVGPSVDFVIHCRSYIRDYTVLILLRADSFISIMKYVIIPQATLSRQGKHS